MPDVEWVDAGPLFWRAAMIKTPEELSTLRESVRLAEVGLRATMLDSDPRGKTVSQLRLEFDDAVRREVAAQPDSGGYQSSRVYMTAGSPIGPNVGRNAAEVGDGSLVWIDCGVTLDGYEADIGRTFQVGPADPTTDRIAKALEAGGEAGFEMLKPGVRHRELYEVTQRAVRENGLPTYTRGHFGHAIGAGGGELHPFVEPEEELEFAPGMVMAYERPYYVRGLGGFQFEDDIAFSESGIEILSNLPRHVLRV
jgi:Xaa-Pro aminopeptidase